jgi:hypothetical protein
MQVLTNHLAIEDNKLYRPMQIVDHGWIGGDRTRHSAYNFVLGLIRAKRLHATNEGLKSVAHYKVSGAEIKRYLATY